jgi:hypothetical protein
MYAIVQDDCFILAYAANTSRNVTYHHLRCLASKTSEYPDQVLCIDVAFTAIKNMLQNLIFNFTST